MALSENIKARRTHLKMSQEYVADQLGISRQAVAKWEAGNCEPTASNLAELATIFEMSISELVDPHKYAEEQKAQENKFKEKQRNTKMLFGRCAAVVLMNAGWDGYSSGLYGTDFPYYWIAILAAGIILLFLTSNDMGKRHKLEAFQVIIGLAMIFSIFFLPNIIMLKQVGVRYLLADVVTAICAIVLDLKYWRHIWKINKKNNDTTATKIAQ